LLIEKVSEKLGISMTPLKDAFRILEQEGLVQNIPRRGTFVTEISSKDVLEYCQIRLALESLAIELTSQQGFDIPKSEIIELRNLNKKVAKALRNKDKKDFVTFDIQFHLKIVSFSKNARLEEMLEHFPLSNFLVVMGGGVMSNSDGEQIIEQHEHIIDALEKKDRDAVKKLIEQNIFIFHSQLLNE
jgi:DNA-binding GntR family transcriptional regulator